MHNKCYGAYLIDEYAELVSPAVLTVARSLPLDLSFLSLDYISNPRTVEISNLFTQTVRQVIDDQAEVQSALDEAQQKLVAPNPALVGTK